MKTTGVTWVVLGEAQAISVNTCLSMFANQQSNIASACLHMCTNSASTGTHCGNSHSSVCCKFQHNLCMDIMPCLNVVSIVHYVNISHTSGVYGTFLNINAHVLSLIAWRLQASCQRLCNLKLTWLQAYILVLWGCEVGLLGLGYLALLIGVFTYPPIPGRWGSVEESGVQIDPNNPSSPSGSYLLHHSYHDCDVNRT